MARDPSGRLPDFLVIGAAKCGTTTLYHYLRRHPGIFMSPTKEPCFFDPDVGWDQGLAWYRSLFSGASQGQLCGEASTHYTRWPQVRGVPERVASVIPDAKLIYLVRDPVQRSYAHYVHRISKEVRPGRPIDQSFEEFVAEDPMCLDGSDYWLQLQQYLPHFPRENLLLLLMEDLAAHPSEALGRVFRFLGADDRVDVVGRAPLVSNTRDGFHEMRIRAEVTAPLRRNALLRRLAYLGPQSWRNLGFRILRRTPHGRRVSSAWSPPPMRRETRRELTRRYRPSNRELSERLGLDLSSWGARHR